MADAALTAVTFLAKVAIRIMQLMEVQKQNIKYSADMIKRIKSINHILTILASLPKDILKDLEVIVDDLREVLEETEEFVSQAVEEATGKKTTFFGRFKKARTIQNAEVVRDKLTKMDDKLDRHLQLLTAAQGAKQLQQSARIEEQVKSLEALSSQMFAFTLMANGMKQSTGGGNGSMPPAMTAEINNRLSRRVQQRLPPSEFTQSSTEIHYSAADDDTSVNMFEIGGGDDDEKRSDAVTFAESPVGKRGAVAEAAAMEKISNPVAAQIEELIAMKNLPLAADPGSQRIARFCEMAAHQFVCGTFVGGLAMLPDDPAKRVSIIFTVPLMPIFTMLVFAYFSNQLKTMWKATDRKSFLKMCWTIYRLYATPGIVAACILAFEGRLQISDGIAMYSDYISCCVGGIAFFLFGFWLSE